MNLLEIILYIALIGAVVWLICKIPMVAQFRDIIIAIAVIFIIIFVLQSFGLLSSLPRLRLIR